MEVTSIKIPALSHKNYIDFSALSKFRKKRCTSKLKATRSNFTFSQILINVEIKIFNPTNKVIGMVFLVAFEMSISSTFMLMQV